MSREDGMALVRCFIDRMEALQDKHFRSLPQSIHAALVRFKLNIGDKSLSVEKKSMLSKKIYYLQNLCNLKILGFNSQGSTGAVIRLPGYHDNRPVTKNYTYLRKNSGNQW